MKTYLDCLPCFLSQALRSARIITSDEKVQGEILREVMEILGKISLDATPPEIARTVYQKIKNITGESDPYRQTKRRHNEIALGIYPELKAMAGKSEDPLYFAIKLAIAGNIIDMGLQKEIKDIKKEVFSAMSSPLKTDHYSRFIKIFNQSQTLLYLGDNAGEIVFDRLLIEELKRIKDIRVFFLVRGTPIINDATMTDAEFVDMGKIAEVISNGFDAPATVLSGCTPKVQALFREADMIISKGQGNYESLSEEKREIFFLLKAKCPVAAGHLGVMVGDAVLKGQRGL